MSKNHQNHAVFLSALVFSWAALFYPLLEAIKKTGIYGFCVNFVRGFYLPHANFQVGKISGVNIYLYAYAFFFCLMLTRWYVKRFRREDMASVSYLHPKTIAAVLLALMILFQAVSRLAHFDSDIRYYVTREKDQRYISFLRGLHAFARECKGVFPGTHNAEFISDLDLNEEIPEDSRTGLWRIFSIQLIYRIFTPGKRRTASLSFPKRILNGCSRRVHMERFMSLENKGS